MTSSPPSPASDDPVNESSSTDDEEANARRETDIRERDAFSKRLRECDDDDEQTKKKFKPEPVSQDSDRSKSRRAYLEKRKDKKVQELEDELADEKRLFEGVKLTKREQELLMYFNEENMRDKYNFKFFKFF